MCAFTCAPLCGAPSAAAPAFGAELASPSASSCFGGLYDPSASSSAFASDSAGSAATSPRAPMDPW
eukprot:1194451-Prorocentrum_minimum.AAC.6